MRFVDKVFSCVVGVSLAATAAVFTLDDRRSAEAERKWFFDHYESLGRQLGMTFTEVERATDNTVLNAAYFLRSYVAQHGLQDRPSLQNLAGQARVDAFGFIDENGVTGVYSDSHCSVGSVNIFALCEDYRQLLTGDAQDFVLPFAPKRWKNTDFGWAAQKFAFVATEDKKWVISSSVLTGNLWSFLQNAVNADENVLQVGMEMQNGAELAKVLSPHLGDRKADNVPIAAKPEDLRGGSDMARLRFVVPSSCPVCCECKTKGVLEDANDTSYRMEILVSLEPLRAARAARLRYAGTVCALVVLVSAILGRAIARRLVRRIEEISSTTDRVLQTGDLNIRAAEGTGNDEISCLARGFNTMMRALRENEHYRTERASMEAMGKVAAQAAHDIRSPVAALNVVAEQSEEMSEEHRLLVLGAVRRVGDIANNLLTKHRKYAESTQMQSEFVAPLVHSVVSEQRALQAKHGVEHTVEISPEASQAFCALEPSLFHRVLSNLMNNAAEAMQESGVVGVSMACVDKQLKLKVSDTGCGIAPEDLERVVRGGFTTKDNGNGMGLSGAAQAVKSWGGNLELDSQVGVGTTITLTMPLASPQAWFAPSIPILAGKAAFVLDDVEAMGRVWQKVLGAFGIEVYTFTQADKFISAVADDPSAVGVALVDYDLLGDARSGLDIIEHLKIADKSVLVTSYYDEEAVRRRCLDLGICIVPKSLAASVPLDLVAPDAQGRRRAC